MPLIALVIKSVDIQPDKRVFAHFKVHSVKVISEKMKFDGAVTKLAECIIGDDQGCLKFVARDA